MKNIKIVILSLLALFTFSSFGGVENNKYVKAKMEKVESQSLSTVDEGFVVPELLMAKADLKEPDEKDHLSISQKIGKYLVSVVQNSFTSVVTFFVELIK